MLGKKGCYRAALEYSKFLLKLNPYEDPVGGLLYLGNILYFKYILRLFQIYIYMIVII